MDRRLQKMMFKKSNKNNSQSKILSLAVEVMCLINKKRKLMILSSKTSFLKAKVVTLFNPKKQILTQLIPITILCQVIL